MTEEQLLELIVNGTVTETNSYAKGNVKVDFTFITQKEKQEIIEGCKKDFPTDPSGAENAFYERLDAKQMIIRVKGEVVNKDTLNGALFSIIREKQTALSDQVNKFLMDEGEIAETTKKS